MKLSKILFGAAIGVGAIAAVPFTGGGSLFAGISAAASLAGGGTIAVAVGAGGLGALAGAAISDLEEEERESERRRAKATGFMDGINVAEAELIGKLNLILSDVKKRDSFLIGLTAFCYAAANVDGAISEEENNELDYYLNQIKINGSLTPAVKGELTKVKDEKSPFDKIVNRLDLVDMDSLSYFEEIMTNIIEADGIRTSEEEAFSEKWRSYYARRKN